MPRTNLTIEQKFWSHINKEGPVPSFKPALGNCWIWTGAMREDGYGYFSPTRGYRQAAHRCSFRLSRGVIPKGKQLDHLCRVHACVRPSHLEPVTQRENQLRGYGASGNNARKTHCIHGHEFTEANIIRRSTGGRWCRACKYAANARRRKLKITMSHPSSS